MKLRCPVCRASHRVGTGYVAANYEADKESAARLKSDFPIWCAVTGKALGR